MLSGAVDEGWVYVSGVLVAEVIAPDNTEDACTTVRFPRETARVWNGVLRDGVCEVS